jgi:hypothetical protein
MARGAKLASHGAFGDALLGEASGALSTLRSLLEQPALRSEPETVALRRTVEQVEHRLSRGELCVVVAGEAGSGKRTFVDALIGDRRLGNALRGIRSTVIVRNNAGYDYCAKFVGGISDDFATRVPDQSDELRAALDDLAQTLARSDSELRAARAEAQNAREQLSAAESALAEGRRALEHAMIAARHTSAELVEVQLAGERAREALTQIERAVPRPLRERRHWWALWLWVLLALFLIVRRSAWKRWHDLRREHDQTLARLPAARQDASGAVQARERAEAEAAQLQAAQGSAQARSSAAHAALERAERERQLLERALAEQKQELDRSAADRLEHFFADLRKLCEFSSRSQQLIELEIDYPAQRLPEDIVLVDSPGITSQDEQERAIAWDVIRERADGCILVTELDRAVSQSTKRFLLQMREVVPHVLLVLTKMDKAFVDAMRRGGTQPWEQVEQARRIGTRRFAREIGRAADEVLSIAVAAQAPLEDPKSGLSRRFELEIEKLFQLLRHERALILGTRAAGVVRRCIAETSDAEQRAERALAERIAALEADRLPNPDEFRRAQVRKVAAELDLAATRALESAVSSVDDGFKILRAQCVQQLTGAPSREALLARATSCEQELASGLQSVASDSARALEQAMDREVRAIEQAIFVEIRRQYQLIHDLRRSSSAESRVEQAIELVGPGVALAAPILATVTSFARRRVALGVLGALVAGAVGSWIALGPGTLAGAVVGPLLLFLVTRAALERRAIAAAHAELERKRMALVDSLRQRAPSARADLEQALDHSLSRVIIRFGRFINEPLEAEQEEIDRQRTSLILLEQLRSALEEHDRRLGQLTSEAMQASIGLCR